MPGGYRLYTKEEELMRSYPARTSRIHANNPHRAWIPSVGTKPQKPKPELSLVGKKKRPPKIRAWHASDVVLPKKNN